MTHRNQDCRADAGYAADHSASREWKAGAAATFIDRCVLWAQFIHNNYWPKDRGLPSFPLLQPNPNPQVGQSTLE
jgi:hypothetical protein